MTTVKLCAIEEIEPGRARRFETEPPVALYRVEDEFYASTDTCSHEDWSLGEDGELEGYEVTCTLHMARFDVRDGRNLCLPALRPVETYPVSVVDGYVFVEL